MYPDLLRRRFFLARQSRESRWVHTSETQPCGTVQSFCCHVDSCQFVRVCMQVCQTRCRPWARPSKIFQTGFYSIDFMMVGSRLPAEILAIITREINEDINTLLALSSVSHAWNEAAESVLYRSVQFRKSGRIYFQLQLLLKKLEKKPHLTSFVRHLNIERWRPYRSIDDQIYTEIASITSVCPNLSRLTLKSCLTMGDQDLLAILENCRSVKEQSISSCDGITSQGFLKVLPFLKNLRKLDVEYVVDFGDDCLSGTAKMCPLLEDLDLSATDVAGNGVSSILELATNLTSLCLWQCYGIGDSEMRAIMKRKPSHVKITASDRQDICDSSGTSDSGAEW
ncbi:hypothetical protein DFS34DRAFT_689443 [Phlyctochytrium arcticum]|nr:hypothetical protein DFS34DRAFT_689443 [Phlyctochytrium arcticum]